MTGTRRILMIAYHFPPHQGSSGIQRSLRMVQDLPTHGWTPIVLTAHVRAYDSPTSDLMDAIPSGVEVLRAQAWDAARHFSVRGRYPGILARPDRWMTWLPFAVQMGMDAIRRQNISLIWSTFPIATAHQIGVALARKTGVPLVADFRDPMAQDSYPDDPAVRKAYSRIEQLTVKSASLCTVTTPSALRHYRMRYPDQATRFSLSENGYDESAFNGLQKRTELNPGCLTILHSGLVYPSERDPAHLIAALAQLKSSAPDIYGRIRLRFRAPGKFEPVTDLARAANVTEAIQVLPQIGYAAALQEMMDADALMILQAANCNQQIPAKLYEYLRVGRPIIALTDHSGDTAAVLRNAGVDTIASLTDALDIQRLLRTFANSPESFPLASKATVKSASRAQRTAALVPLFNSICGGI